MEICKLILLRLEKGAETGGRCGAEFELFSAATAHRQGRWRRVLLVCQIKFVTLHVAVLHLGAACTCTCSIRTGEGLPQVSQNTLCAVWLQVSLSKLSTVWLQVSLSKLCTAWLQISLSKLSTVWCQVSLSKLSTVWLQVS